MCVEFLTAFAVTFSLALKMLTQSTLIPVLFLLSLGGCRRQAEVPEKAVESTQRPSVTEAVGSGGAVGSGNTIGFWTAKSIGVSTPHQAKARFAKEDPELFAELTKVGSTDLQESEKPTNCRRWRKLKADGYVPNSELAQQIDDAAKVACVALELLEGAGRAERSHVREIDWSESLMRLLPPGIHPRTSPSDRQVAQDATKKGMSFKQFRATARFQRIREDLEGERYFRIEDPDANSVILGRFLACADVDRDGAEDLMISIVNLDAESEQYLQERIFALTRHDDTEVLRVLRSE